MAKLKHLNFILEICHNNGEINISVSDDCYSANSLIYCCHEEYVKFVAKLDFLFLTLREGKAVLRDDEYIWSRDDFTIKFESDGLGHFIVHGFLTVDCDNWKLEFEKTIDQTFFKSFIMELKKEING